jgi:hypothetical protein
MPEDHAEENDKLKGSSIPEPRQAPKDLLQAALAEELTDRYGSRLKIALFPPVTQQDLEQFEADSGNPVPQEIRELLQFCGGFEFPPVGKVDFLGRDMSVETPFASMPILADDCGNFWVVDLESGGNWGPVMFWCHDPAVVVVGARNLSDFMQQIFEIGRPQHLDNLAFVQKERSHQIWKDDPYLVSAIAARESNDSVLSAFARSLTDAFYIADLRKVASGAGFSWGKSISGLKRNGTELMFAVEKKKSLFRKLFRRSS